MKLILQICSIAVGLASCVSMAIAEPTTSPSASVKIVLVGDSTVCNYALAKPDRGWGMFIEERFKPGTVQVVNLAAAGRSTKTFIEEGRWRKALDEKPQFVLIQFGHNDSHDPKNHESTDAGTDYQANLRRYIDDARAIGATSILVTPMVRRDFGADGKIKEGQAVGNLRAYADAMKEIGNEKKTPTVDLYTSSKALAEKIGPEAAAKMANKKGDITHFNETGARAMADLVMKELPTVAPSLGELVAQK